MANSDIIKIGFDYRASLEQFEKETNGVFEGISDKAGKQKITIQLDAKDDKIIDKINTMLKNLFFILSLHHYIDLFFDQRHIMSKLLLSNGMSGLNFIFLSACFHAPEQFRVQQHHNVHLGSHP